MTSEVLVLVRDERVRGSLFAGAARPTDAVSVCVYVPRDVVVDHRMNVWNVETTGYVTDDGKLHNGKGKH